MTVLVELWYISNDNRVFRRGSFSDKKKPEEVAFEWWKQVRREMPFGGDLEKVTANGEDITEIVKKMDRDFLK